MPEVGAWHHNTIFLVLLQWQRHEGLVLSVVHYSIPFLCARTWLNKHLPIVENNGKNEAVLQSDTKHLSLVLNGTICH
jgi:hypothetical protein